MKTRVCVTGSAGFIAGHLCHYLRERGYWVRAVDYVRPRYGDVDCNEGLWCRDLRDYRDAKWVTEGVDWVFGLAASMGGAGYVFTGENDLEILHDNALININTLKAACLNGVKRYTFSSSMCIYPDFLQSDEARLLNESLAYPSRPDSAYGKEKLFTEALCGAYNKQTDMLVHIPRFGNIYGERGAWRGGREKLPAAACRKVAVAKLTGNPEVEIWGDGTAVRSYCHVSDLVEMLHALMCSDYTGPMNLGQDELYTVDEVFDTVARVADTEIVKRHIPGPVGIHARKADLTLMRTELGISPRVSLEDGLSRTYAWIEEQVREALEHGEEL